MNEVRLAGASSATNLLYLPNANMPATPIATPISTKSSNLGTDLGLSSPLTPSTPAHSSHVIGEEVEKEVEEERVTTPTHTYTYSYQAPPIDISTFGGERGGMTTSSFISMVDKMRPKSVKDFSLQAPISSDFGIQAPPPSESIPYNSHSGGSGGLGVSQRGESGDANVDDDDDADDRGQGADLWSESASESAKTRRNRKKRLKKEAKKKLDPIDEVDLECGLMERPWSDEIVGPASVVSKTIYSPYSESEVVIEIPSSNSPSRDRMDVLLSSPEVQQQHTLAACDGNDGVEFDSSSGSEGEEEGKTVHHHDRHHHPVTPVPAAMDEEKCSKFVPASALATTVASPASAVVGTPVNVSRVHSDDKNKGTGNNAHVKDNGKDSVIPCTFPLDPIPSSSSSLPHQNLSVRPSNAEVVIDPVIDPFAFEDDKFDPFAFEEEEGDPPYLYP